MLYCSLTIDHVEQNNYLWTPPNNVHYIKKNEFSPYNDKRIRNANK